MWLTRCRDIPLEEFEYTLNVNLRASFVLVKGVIEGMKEQKWGRIIFMSSIAAQGGGINGCRKSFYDTFLTVLTFGRLCSIKRRAHRHDEESFGETCTIKHLSQRCSASINRRDRDAQQSRCYSRRCWNYTYGQAWQSTGGRKCCYNACYDRIHDWAELVDCWWA